MTYQLLPPPDLDHPLPDHLSHEQLASLWIDILETGETLLMAGIRARLPLGGDVTAVHRAWYEGYCRDHLAMLERMADRFNQIQALHGSHRGPQNP
jgi:hypothetical protein